MMRRSVVVWPNGSTSIDSGKRPSMATRLDASAITTQRREASQTSFSRKQRAAGALEAGQAGADLVGAVDGQVDGPDLVQAHQIEPELDGDLGRAA